MNKYLKLSLLLIVFTVVLGVSFSSFSEEVRAVPQTQAQGQSIEQAVPMGHFGPCYPWVWSWGTWWHHHVYWYAQAVWVYHPFFQRYVWQCTWLGCGAIHF